MNFEREDSEEREKREERERIRLDLIRAIARRGYPVEFGMIVADNLRTEKTMSRMIGYLRHANPKSAEEIADEMLSIMEDRNRWVKKKAAEFYNSKYNELLYYGLGTDDTEDEDTGNTGTEDE